MKKIFKYMTLVTLGLLLSACSLTSSFSHNGRLINSSNSFFKKGDYTASSLALISILQDTPRHKEALNLISERLDLAIYNIQEEIKENDNLLLTAEKYEILNKIHTEYFKLPKSTRDLIKNETINISSLKELTLEAYYNAIQNSNYKNNNLTMKRKKLYFAEKLITLDSNYKDIATLYDSIQNDAIQKIILKEFQLNNEYEDQLKPLLYDTLIRDLKDNSNLMAYSEIINLNNLNYKMKKNISKDDLKSKTVEDLASLIKADIIISTKILAIDYVPPHTTFKKYADKVKYTKESRLTIMALCEIKEVPSGNIIKTLKKNYSIPDSVTWIIPNDSSLLSSQREQYTKTKLELANIASINISKEIAYSITKFFKKKSN